MTDQETIEELQEVIDFAKLQIEFSERTGCRVCDDCERMGYIDAARHGAVTLDDENWAHEEHAAGMVKRCAECKTHNASKPFKWIADIDPVVFIGWMQGHMHAFDLNDLRVLLNGPVTK